MEELTARQNQLPMMADTEVKKFVDDIGFAIDAIRAKRTVAGRYGMDKATLDEMDAQIIQLSAVKLEALMELGDRTAAIEVGKTGPRSFFQGSEKNNTKSDKLSEIGISPQRAQEAEQLAKNRDVVEQYIEEKVAKGEAPSKNGALNEIKKQSEYITEGENDTERKVNRGNPASLVPGGFSKEERERRAYIASAAQMLYDTGTDNQYDLDSLICDIEANGNSACSVLKSLIEPWKHLFESDEGRKEIAKAIDNYYWRNIIRLKGEFNL